MEQSLTSIYSALAHPIRRGTLEQLREGSQLVHELAQHFRVSAPAFSKHLRVLEDAQLIQREKRGREQHISINSQVMQPAVNYLQQYEAHWQSQLEALDKYVKNKEK